MNKQSHYRQEYHRLNPEWQESLIIYRDLIDQCVSSTTRVLDVGCGHGEFLEKIYRKTPHTYGIDPDQDALNRNTFIKNKIVSTADHLPFPDQTFDLVVSAWVLEHLATPEKAFREIHRVLKPGGQVIFLTPNAWNYNVWIIRLIPEIFHDFLTRKLYNRQEHDTYQKFYRINTVGKITKTLQYIGFHQSRLILNGDPSYISFNKPLFWLACLIENILNIRSLNFMKVHLIGIFRK